MSLIIRSYCNTDTSQLCRVFNAHFQAVGLLSAITPLTLELCVLSKPYFEPDLCLVAEWEHEIVGFTQAGFEPDGTLQTLSDQLAVINGPFVVDTPHAFDVAHALLQTAVERLLQHGATRVRTSPPPPATPYFAGLAPGDCMVGVPDGDVRLKSWYEQAQWRPVERVVNWENDLGRFQPPMDRTQIQIRRMAHVDRLLDEPLLPWFVASMLGHAEQIGFQLTSRQTRTVTADIVLWTIGHELLPQPEVVARLWPLTLEDCRQKDDQMIFLLAEAFRQLREDRVDLVRTISSDHELEVVRLLERIGFTAVVTGHVYQMQW